MPIHNGIHKYKEQKIMHASKEELLIIIFDGLIGFLRKGQKAIEEGGIEESHKNLVRSQEIISHLINTLDFKYPLASQLLLLYEYMMERVERGNVKKDPAYINEVITMAMDLRETFEKARLSLKQEKMCN